MMAADALDRGREFLSAFTSSLLGGVGRDAEHIAETIASRPFNGRPLTAQPATSRDTESQHSRSDDVYDVRGRSSR